MGAIVLLIGVAGLGVVIVAVVVFAVTRSRRNSGMGGPVGGTYPRHILVELLRSFDFTPAGTT